MQKWTRIPTTLENAYSQPRLREAFDWLATSPPFVGNDLDIQWLPDEVIVSPFSGVIRGRFYVNDAPLHIPIRYEHRGKKLRILLVYDHASETIRVRVKSGRMRLREGEQIQEILLSERRIPASIWAK